MTTDSETDGPVAQSIATGFKVLFGVTAALALAWAVSNWRQVPADAQAVVLRFGRIVEVKTAGLTVSWPPPVDSVVLLPGEQRLLTVRTASTLRTGGLVDEYTRGNDAKLPEGSSEYLTGDGGVVLLGGTISYRVTDGEAYYLAQSHVEPALLRLFQACAVDLVATRALDDIMVAEPLRRTSDTLRAAAEGRRQALRSDLARAMNARLSDLAAHGASLGVEVARVDADAALPPSAKLAYEGVLVAAQMAEQGIADARTAATRTAQAADREHDRIVEEAKASAQERVGAAQSRTAPILAVRNGMVPATREATLDQLYREGMEALLPKVGRIIVVYPDGSSRTILPATNPMAGSTR